MGKVIFWIVVVFVVLFALRILNMGAAKRRAREPGTAKGPAPGDTMVRCSNAACTCPRPKRCPRRAATSAAIRLARRAVDEPRPGCDKHTDTLCSLMQPSPAAPSFEPPVPMSTGDSSRRILWIVGLYRAVCGAGLLGIALLLDLKALGIVDPTRSSRRQPCISCSAW